MQDFYLDNDRWNALVEALLDPDSFDAGDRRNACRIALIENGICPASLLVDAAA